MTFQKAKLFIQELISDFSTYPMFSNWSTAGRLACPCCMDNSDEFTLSKSDKQCWFNNHHEFFHSEYQIEMLAQNSL